LQGEHYQITVFVCILHLVVVLYPALSYFTLTSLLLLSSQNGFNDFYSSATRAFGFSLQ